MQFTSFALAAAAFVGSASAKVILTPVTYAGITVGTAFNISYSDAAGPVTLSLDNGPATALVDVETIKSGLPAGSGYYVWTPESSLAADTYAIKITDGQTTNYGGLFQLLGATASPSSSAASSTASSAATTGTSTSSGATSASTTGSPSSIATSSNSSTTSGSKITSSPASKTSSGPSTTSTASVPGGSGASGLASPLAMVLLALVAVLSFN